MNDVLEAPEVPANAGSPAVQSIDYSHFESKFNLGDIPETPSQETVPDNAPPAEPPVSTPVQPDRKAQNSAQAQKRIDEKTSKVELEAARARVAELESWQSEHTTKFGETENRLTEFKTLAEQREQRIKEIEEGYRNEADPFNSGIIEELPQIREARSAFEQQYNGIFPKHLSNPDNNEPFVRFDPSVLNNERVRTQVGQNIDFWEKMDIRNDVPPETKAAYQQVAVSNIAAAIGVSRTAFDTVSIGGKEYSVLPPSHPAYKHLSHKLPDLIEAGSSLNSKRAAAFNDRTGAFQQMTSTRAGNTHNLYKELGLGATGDSLKTALSKNPDSPILKLMGLLEGQPDLVEKLKSEMDAEASLNGHFRPQLDLLESDPVERTKTANAHLARVGRRVINAPVGVVAMELALRQHGEIAELKSKLAAAQAEATRAAIQTEPGVVLGSSEERPSDLGPYAAIAARLNLA